MVTDAHPSLSSESAIAEAQGTAHDNYRLELYIIGAAPRSLRAIANLKTLCENALPGRYELSVIDLYQQPELAKQAQIVVVPTLIRCHPAPARRLIGDLSDTAKLRILLGLGV